MSDWHAQLCNVIYVCDEYMNDIDLCHEFIHLLTIHINMHLLYIFYISDDHSVLCMDAVCVTPMHIATNIVLFEEMVQNFTFYCATTSPSA